VGGPAEHREEGWLLLVKPGLKDDDSEPVDVRQYWRERGDFPQQTTADQFFDEAQWEARRLTRAPQRIAGSASTSRQPMFRETCSVDERFSRIFVFTGQAPTGLGKKDPCAFTATEPLRETNQFA
jgi:hypothetical protein